MVLWRCHRILRTSGFAQGQSATSMPMKPLISHRFPTVGSSPDNLQTDAALELGETLNLLRQSRFNRCVLRLHG